MTYTTPGSSTDESICLTLSGGGFRATLFHLGVIRALAEAGKLRHVRQVVSVSGGSVMGAHLVLQWELYAPAGPFDEKKFDIAAKQIIAATKFNVRGRITQWMWSCTALRLLLSIPSRLLRPFGASPRWLDTAQSGLTATAWLERYFDRLLFQKAKLQDLKPSGIVSSDDGPPTIWIMATNLSRGDACVYSDNGFLPAIEPQASPGTESPTAAQHSERAEERTFGRDQISVAEAVAASAAFPGFFSASGLRHWRLNWKPEHYQGDCQYIADGGILDNMGAMGVLGIGVSQPAKYYVISDASGAATWDKTDRMGFAIGTAARTLDVMTDRMTRNGVHTLEERLPASSRTVVSIHKRHRWNDSVSDTVQTRIPNVRTDFDKFSDVEIGCLIRHGYDMTWHSLAKGGTPSRKKTLTSCGGIVLLRKPKKKIKSRDETGKKKIVYETDWERINRKMARASRRRMWLIAPFLPVFWLLPVAICLIGWLVWYRIDLHDRTLAIEAAARQAEVIRSKDAEARRVARVHKEARQAQWQQLASVLRSTTISPLCQPNLQLVGQGNAPDLAGFDVLSEDRTIDVRGWKRATSTPPSGSKHNPSTESFLVVHSIMRVRKLADKVWLELPMATNGSDVVVRVLGKHGGEIVRPHVADPTEWKPGQESVTKPEGDPSASDAKRDSSKSEDDDKRLVLRVNVQSDPIGSVCEIEYTATCWNALQEIPKTFVGVPIHSPSESVSLLVLWPMGSVPSEVRPFRGPPLPRERHASADEWGYLEHDVSHGFTAWTIPASSNGPVGSAAILEFALPEK